MKYSEYSVVIIGSGAAGLYAALKISQQINLPEGVLIVTKSTLGESNSKYAQGGIVGVVHQNPNDKISMHVNDTLKAGAGLSEEKTTEYISAASDEVLNDLIQNQLDFLPSLHLLSKWETPNTASQIPIASAGSGIPTWADIRDRKLFGEQLGDWP